MSAWFSTVASEPRLRLHVTTEGCEVCWPIEARACDTWEVGVTESREESRRHYLRHAAGSPRPPAQSVLCVRDGRCAAGPEAQLEFEPGGRSRWAEPRRSRPLGPHRKRTFGLTALTVHCHRAHRAGSPLGSFRRDTHTAAAGRALTCLSPRAGRPSGLGDFAALRGALCVPAPKCGCS